MIARLSGEVTDTTPDAVILDVGGVGYLVHVTLETKLSLAEGEKTSLYTHLAVREQSMDLYGFREQAELRFFEMLISISGVGPKTALGILSLADVSTLQSAIASGDISYLTKVSGIGKKSAERIVIELRDKLQLENNEHTTGAAHDVDVLEALVSLGYSTSQARAALKDISKDMSGTTDRLKAALQLLSGK